VALAAAAFVAASLLLARWLSTDNVERDAVIELLRAQARGDGDRVVAALACGDAACRATARANARRLRSPGDVQIVRYDSSTARSSGARAGPTRVVWLSRGRRPTVQCVLVRREGDPLRGISVTLVALSAPIGGEAACR
jgi:hypothetical protein